MSSEARFDRGVSGIVHKVCRDFRRNELEPVALELDSHYQGELMEAIWRKSAELELPSMLVPEEQGGVGQDMLTAAQVLDELAGGCPGIATIFALHLAGCVALVESGRRELLGRIAESGEERPLSLTLSLPGFVHMEDGPRLSEEGGELYLDGTLPLVGCAPIADYIILFVEDVDGISALTLEAGGEGMEVEEPAELLGLHTVPFCDVSVRRREIGAGDLLAERGGAGALMERTLAAWRGFVAAMATGAARTAYALAHSYARERFQFGKMIVEHHEIKRLLAGMVTRLEMATSGYIEALSGEGMESSPAGRPGDLAKIYCTDAALETVLDAIQIHGGYGYMKETGLEKLMRDSKMLQLLDKSNRLLEVELID